MRIRRAIVAFLSLTMILVIYILLITQFPIHAAMLVILGYPLALLGLLYGTVGNDG